MNALGEIPPKRMKHASVIYGSYLFIFGGCDDQNYNEKDANNNNANAFNALYVIALDKSPLTWHKLCIPNLPQRIRHSFHVLHSIESDNYLQLSLVIVCGEDKNAYLQNDIFILQCKAQINIESESEEKKENESCVNKNIFECLVNSQNWKVMKLEGIPLRFAPRFGHSSVVLSAMESDKERVLNIVVFGGYSGEMSVLNDFWLISVEMNGNGLCTLKECKLLGIKGVPSERHGQSMSVCNNNRLVIYGGINLMFVTFNDVTIINIDLKQWKGMKAMEYKPKGGGMSENEKTMAKQQLKNMGFTDDMINNVLVNAANFDDALGKLLG